MRTKKCGVFAALAVTLLITAALITSCVKPVDSSGISVSQGNQPETFVPPEGMGYLRLNLKFNSSDARTIMPDTSLYDELSDFDTFDIYVLNGATVVASSIGVTSTAAPTTIAVVPGTYTVKVFGNKELTPFIPEDPGPPPVPEEPATYLGLAVGEATGVVVAAAPTINSATVTLKEIVDGTGNGTFSWDLTEADTTPAASAQMSIIPLSGGTADYQPYGTNLVTGNAGAGELTSTAPLALKSGYYRVEIAQTRPNHASVKTVSVLHVYQGFDSEFVYDLPNLRLNVYTVTFNYNDGEASPTFGAPITGVPHGSTTAIIKPSDPVHRGDALIPFVNWYTEATGGTVFAFAGDLSHPPVINNLTLYARWLTGEDLDITIDDIEYSSAVEPQLTVSSAGILSQGSGTMTVTLTNPGAYDTWEWLLDGAATDASFDDSPTFTFSTATIANKVLGTYTVTLVATLKDDIIPYSNDITFTVTAP